MPPILHPIRRAVPTPILTLSLTLGLFLAHASMALPLDPSAAVSAQESRRLFPPRSLMSVLLAGPRDPITSANALAVTQNPDDFGSGVEVEVSLGSRLPLFLLAGEPGDRPLLVGIEGAAFARFGLQVVERELIASDWIFAIPLLLRTPRGWVRFRYYHSSSHMGDEYARRFDAPGINFSRDAAELMVLRRIAGRLEAYGGARYAYNVHPEESKRWVARVGAQVQGTEAGRPLLPFAALDLEWDQDADSGVRTSLQAGVWLPEVGGRRVLRLSLDFLSGPSPLGQFNGLRTTQFGLGLRGDI